MPSTPSRGSPVALIQVMLAASCMATAMLVPPAEGTLLAVPLRGTQAQAINVALAHGARIEGAGPFAGWIVLRGRRALLARPLLAQGVVLLAGASWMCRA